MPIANIANIPEDWISLQQWSFAHMAHHADLNSYILRTKGISLPVFPIDPVNPDDLGTFSYQHQVMHNNQNKVLGIAGNDLLDVDWRDRAQLENFIFLNFSEHFQASQITGVG